MMAHSRKKNILTGILGNIFDHYDSALFGLLGPFIAPLFFRTSSPIVALILFYGIQPLGLVSRPLAAIFFGRIGDRFGRRVALSISLLGMTMTTIGLGSLPTYDQAGAAAPILLALGRCLQQFFGAGAVTGGALLVLESTERRKRNLMSGLFDASSVGGILLASAGVALLSHLNLIETHWRALLWLGALTGVIGFSIRFSTEELPPEPTKKSSWKNLWEARGSLCRIAVVTGFSYTLYTFALILMNAFLPLITPYSKSEIMQLNTGLLVLDMALLPLFGWLATKYSRERLMRGAAIATLLLSIPLFNMLEGASWSMLIFVRVLLVAIGVCFAASFHAWAIDCAPDSQRYTVTGLGKALGSQLFGAPAAAISLWLYNETHWVFAPALYLILIAAGAVAALTHTPEAEAAKNPL